MRPLRLEIEGFTAFRERQEIDFEPLDLFVITGPTGAGKTSILDAMAFALYGEVPRLGGQQGTSDIVSLGRCSPHVEFEFSIDDKGRYRVARRLSRAEHAQTATLERRDGSDWVPAREGGVRECNQRIAELLGLNFDAFTRAVAAAPGRVPPLPQGRHRRTAPGPVLAAGRLLLPADGCDRRTRRKALEAAVQRTDELLAEQYADATAERLADARRPPPRRSNRAQPRSPRRLRARQAVRNHRTTPKAGDRA